MFWEEPFRLIGSHGFATDGKLIHIADPRDPSARNTEPADGKPANEAEELIPGFAPILEPTESRDSWGREVDDLTGRLKRPPTENIDEEKEKMDEGFADKLSPLSQEKRSTGEEVCDEGSGMAGIGVIIGKDPVKAGL
ncbi:hypothetical protein QFC19_003958 [Naganishia cerealis]|uniref:Uncharacterized protein n=1 Tax=Naganishia cerealis TaxID=610337 RepID=A0ACC2VY26_9TREE|nr:hypothetical protein QFC19_003958 [Naganishia cerealis]